MSDANSLAAELSAASEAYYNTGTPVMSDAEFDAKKEELHKLNPDHPVLAEIGAPTSEHLEKVKHNIPMGSLNNANNGADFESWFEKTNTGMTSYVAMHKLDGSSVEIVYKKGKLVQGITRGDGIEGEDVTQNVRNFKNVPNDLTSEWSGSVRGEAMLLKADFEEYFSGSANPRNAANGTVRRSDGTGSEHLVFYAFDVGENGFDAHMDKLAFLENLGFEVVSHELFSDGAISVSDHERKQGILDYREAQIEVRESLPYEIDGVVVRVNDNDEFKALGERDNRPKGAVAFKLNAVEATTTLEYVELSLGHTGAIIPTAKLKAVHLMGVTVTSALLNNFEEIERLGVAIGDEVKVIRAGDVIPKIIGVAQDGEDRQPIEVPTACIVCNSLLVKDGAHLFCRNDACEGKEEMRLKNWIKKRDIKYVGDSLREKLFNTNAVRSPHELYALTEEYLSGVPIGAGVVGGNAKRIMAEIEKSKTATLSEFMGSLGVKFLGRRQAVHMIEGGIDTLEKFTDLTIERALELDGFSTSKASQIVNGIQACLGEVHALREAGVEVTEPSQEPEPEVASGSGELAGKSFCFTGKIERVGEDGKRFTRSLMQDLVMQNGGSVMDKVRGGLTYLVQADPDSQSSKSKKAEKLGTEILSEAAFFEMVGI